MSIGLWSGFFGSRHVFRRSDPSAANYNAYSNPVDSGLLTHSDVMPSSGWFVPGTFVKSAYNDVAFTAGKRLAGWRRLTWTDSHVLGTDWAPVYEYAQ